MKPLHRFFAATAAKGFHPWRITLAASLLLIASLASAATEYPAGDLRVGDHIPLGAPVKLNRSLLSVEYSNVTNFLGQGFVNGGSALQGANRITRLVADDILPTGDNAGQDVLELTFSVANFNAVPVTVRPRVRFWFDNAGAPGAYYNLPAPVGFSFNPLTFSPGVTVVTGTLAPGLFDMPQGIAQTAPPFWAGITFDDLNGTTGITAAQLDMVGQGIFDPSDIGFSDDVAFQTTAAGSFFGVNDPVGGTFNFAGAPPASFGWEFIADDATPVANTSWGRIKSLYK